MLISPKQFGPKSDAGLLGPLPHLFLKDRPLRSRLLKTGREYDRAAHAFLRALVQDLRDGRRRHGNDDQVQIIVNFQHISIAAHAQNTAVFGVDRIYDPRIATRQQVAKDGLANAVFACTGTDNGNCARCK